MYKIYKSLCIWAIPLSQTCIVTFVLQMRKQVHKNEIICSSVMSQIVERALRHRTDILTPNPSTFPPQRLGSLALRRLQCKPVSTLGRTLPATCPGDAQRSVICRCTSPGWPQDGRVALKTDELAPFPAPVEGCSTSFQKVRNENKKEKQNKTIKLQCLH